jgi:hypothetical protein
MATQKVSRDKLLERAVEEDAIPNELLTEEQAKRRINREKKRRERTRQQHEKTASIAASEKEWWAGNRAALSSEELEAMQEQDAYIRDLLFSMETVVDAPQSDPVLIEIVEDLVKERGTVHLGYTHKDPDIPSDWSTSQYWRDAALLEKLENENKQTAQYVRYGLLDGLPDWRAEQFLTGKARWAWQKAATFLGYHIDHRDQVSYR